MKLKVKKIIFFVMKVKKIIFTTKRKEAIFKLCLNFSTILFASMLASEFFAKMNFLSRILLLLLLFFLIIISIAVHSNENEEK